MLNHVIYLYGFNLAYAKKLVADVTPEQLCQQPGGVVNHPAWSLGHLSVSSDYLLKFLGKDSLLPVGWEARFKTGGVPTANVSDYPTKDEMVSTLDRMHKQVVEAVKATGLETFNEPHPDENKRTYFPTKGDLIIFLMTAHEMDHLGQVAAWRRAMGIGSATGT